MIKFEVLVCSWLVSLLSQVQLFCLCLHCFDFCFALFCLLFRLVLHYSAPSPQNQDFCIVCIVIRSNGNRIAMRSVANNPQMGPRIPAALVSALSTTNWSTQLMGICRSVRECVSDGCLLRRSEVVVDLVNDDGPAFGIVRDLVSSTGLSSS